MPHGVLFRNRRDDLPRRDLSTHRLSHRLRLRYIHLRMSANPRRRQQLVSPRRLAKSATFANALFFLSSGAVGHVCVVKGGFPSCLAGICGILSCVTPYRLVSGMCTTSASARARNKKAKVPKPLKLCPGCVALHSVLSCLVTDLFSVYLELRRLVLSSARRLSPKPNRQGSPPFAHRTNARSLRWVATSGTSLFWPPRYLLLLNPSSLSLDTDYAIESCGGCTAMNEGAPSLLAFPSLLAADPSPPPRRQLPPRSPFFRRRLQCREMRRLLVRRRVPTQFRLDGVCKSTRFRTREAGTRERREEGRATSALKPPSPTGLLLVCILTTCSTPIVVPPSRYPRGLRHLFFFTSLYPPETSVFRRLESMHY